MIAQKPHVLIFSSDNWKEVTEVLKSNFIPFTQGLGVYNGNAEVNFLVDLGQYGSFEFFERWNIVQSLARKFNQESILYSDNERRTVLIDNNGLVVKELGCLKEVDDKFVPEEHLNYSVFNGSYYVAE